MTFWDFMDRHIIIGPLTLCFVVFWLAVAVVDVSANLRRK